MLRRLLSPWVVAALGAAVYLLVAPPSADLAAQEYRAELGLTLWNNGWFAGHHTPGYSVLFPPLGGTLGVRLTGALSAVTAAALFAPLARRHWGDRAGAAAALWFAAGTTAVLLTGRLTFLLGVAIGLGALLALARDRRALAALLAAATTLASPVAGLFLALSVTAWALAEPAPQRARAPGAGAPRSPPPRSRRSRSRPSSFPRAAPTTSSRRRSGPRSRRALRSPRCCPRHERALRIGALLYALLLAAAFVVDSPLGGNATRLGALVAGPAVLGALIGRRSPLLIAALAVAPAYWPVYPAVRDVVRASGDPSVQRRLLRAAAGLPESRGRPAASASRSRTPRTTGRRATSRAGGVASRSPAAGSASSTAATARCSTTAAWTPRPTARGSIVTPSPTSPCPTSRSTPPGATRRGSSRRGPPYLREVWRDEHWRVFAVARPAPLAQAGAGVRAAASLTPDRRQRARHRSRARWRCACASRAGGG